MERDGGVTWRIGSLRVETRSLNATARIVETVMIRERVKSGLERARARGQTLGRPPIDAEKEAAICVDLRLGKAGSMKLAAAHGVGVRTVQRIKAALAG
jgi:DNA invertase Pin-like site-specific DNA recombinase